MKTLQMVADSDVNLGLMMKHHMMLDEPVSSSSSHIYDVDASKMQAPQYPAHSNGGGLTRTHTLHSLCGSSSTASSSHSSSLGPISKEDSHTKTTSSNSTRERSNTSSPTINAPLPSPDFTTFGMDVRRYTQESPDVPVFDAGMRRVLEPHMRKARQAREAARKRFQDNYSHDSIASSAGVSYVRLRSERPFLYDIHTHPIHEVMAETLGVKDLTKLHEHVRDVDQIMAPLKSRKERRRFQESYDQFVTSFCIPLLHSMAMAQNLFHGVHSESDNTKISYRYQAFPDLRVLLPGGASLGPHCDTSKGHSVGFLHFYIPLTPSFGTNALYTESHPGREDWHPLQTKSVGLGFLMDGGRCIRFNLENTTDFTMVALDFVVAIYSDQQHHGMDFPIMDPDGLCNQMALEDMFTLSGSDFYDEATIDLRPCSLQWQCVAKKHSRRHKLLELDACVGFPYT